MTDERHHIDLPDTERTPCEVWTRVMGYHRPVSAFNPGKQSEHAERLHFREDAVRDLFAWCEQNPAPHIELLDREDISQ
jgi:hypothetical protein